MLILHNIPEGNVMQLYKSIFNAVLLVGVITGAGSLVTATAQETKMYPGKTDVFYSSGNRLPPINRDDLDEFGKKVYDDVLAGGRTFTYDEKKKEYLGPRSIRIYSPIVSDHLSTANEYLRYESGMDPKIREIAIMNAAWEMNIAYEWTAHEETAIEVGVPQSTIDIIKFNQPISATLGEQETAVIILAREVLRGSHQVSAETYKKVHGIFGTKRLLEIVALMGGYTGTAMVLHTFDQQLPPGKQSLLPPR
jgi:4-carboxymuconolactone decarboxylase